MTPERYRDALNRSISPRTDLLAWEALEDLLGWGVRLLETGQCRNLDFARALGRAIELALLGDLLRSWRCLTGAAVHVRAPARGKQAGDVAVTPRRSFLALRQTRDIAAATASRDPIGFAPGQSATGADGATLRPGRRAAGGR